METVQLKVLYKTLDEIKHVENGIEFWYARELYPILGYTRWENLDTTLQRAKEACKKTRSSIDDHFLHVQEKTIVGHRIGKLEGMENPITKC